MAINRQALERPGVCPLALVLHGRRVGPLRRGGRRAGIPSSCGPGARRTAASSPDEPTLSDALDALDDRDPVWLRALSQCAALPLDAIDALFARYGRPLESGAPAFDEGVLLPVVLLADGATRVGRLRHRAPVDVISNDYFLRTRAGEEPSAIPGPLFAAAIAALTPEKQKVGARKTLAGTLKDAFRKVGARRHQRRSGTGADPQKWKHELPKGSDRPYVPFEAPARIKPKETPKHK